MTPFLISKQSKYHTFWSDMKICSPIHKKHLNESSVSFWSSNQLKEPTSKEELKKSLLLDIKRLSPTIRRQMGWTTPLQSKRLFLIETLTNLIKSNKTSWTLSSNVSWIYLDMLGRRTRLLMLKLFSRSSKLLLSLRSMTRSRKRSWIIGKL